MPLPTNYNEMNAMLDAMRAEGRTTEDMIGAVKYVKSQNPKADYTKPVDKSSLGSTGISQTQPNWFDKGVAGVGKAWGGVTKAAGDAVNEVGKTFGESGTAIKNAVTGTTPEGDQLSVSERLQQGAEGMVGGIKGVTDVAMAPLTAVSLPFSQMVSPVLGKDFQATLQNLSPDHQKSVADAMKFLDENPVIGKGVGAIMNLIGVKGEQGVATAAEQAAPAIKEGVQSGVESVGNAVKSGAEDVLNKGKQALSTIYEKTPEFPVPDIVGKIKEISTPKPKSLIEKISPKLSIAEKRAAIAEGRVTKGASSNPVVSKLFGEKPDIVAPTDKLKKVASTIEQRIPDHAKMDEFTLHNAMDKETGKIATELKPEMQKATLKSDLKQKMLDSWEKAKQTQQDTVEFETFPGLKNMQKKFDTFVKELNKNVRTDGGKFRPKSLDDLWETRKTYDQSIPDKVKNATGQSSDLLQAQKDMWLENRKIFNDAIHDAENGLGEASKKAFSDMSDLYTGMHNISSRGEVVTKGTEGFITPKKVLSTAASAAGLGIIGSAMH